MKEEFHSSPFPIWVMGKDCKVFSILLLHEKNKWLSIFFKKKFTKHFFPWNLEKHRSTNIFFKKKRIVNRAHSQHSAVRCCKIGSILSLSDINLGLSRANRVFFFLELKPKGLKYTFMVFRRILFKFLKNSFFAKRIFV